MRKLKLMSLLLLLGVTINTTLAQNNYTNFENELLLDLTVLNESSSGCNGSVKIIPLTGEAPFLFSIDGGLSFMNNDEFDGLCAKKYFVHVRDKNSKLGVALLDLEKSPSDNVTQDTSSDIIELTKQLALYSNQSLEYRKIQWRLYKLKVPQTAIASIETKTNTEISYLIPVIFPNESQESNYQMNVDRVEGMFPESKIVMDYEKWEMKVRIQNYDNQNPIEEIVSYFGFSAIEIKNI